MSLSDEIFSMLTHGTELENSFVKIERCEVCFDLPKEDFGDFGDFGDYYQTGLSICLSASYK